MPNRIIKESINESRGLTSCTFFAQDLYKRIITYADDYGRFNADPQIMLARLYPRELAVVDLDDLMDALVELTGVGKISFYTAKPRKEVYGCFPNWAEHQRLRESKRKLPDPTDTEINDWYLRRFIPIDTKIAILERDAFKCQECGRHVGECDDAARFVKMGFGLFHIDHIVPCQQGGRATMENLRLTCAKCNLSRKRSFTFDEIIEFAASCGELRRDSETCGLNPIQSESESESNPKPKRERARDGGTLSAYFSTNLRHMSSGNYDELREFLADGITDEVARFAVDTATAQGKPTWGFVRYLLNQWLTSEVKTVGDAKAYEQRRVEGIKTAPKPNPALNYEQRPIAGNGDELFIDLSTYGKGGST
jgi:DnaD/phage-associated family protein